MKKCDFFMWLCAILCALLLSCRSEETTWYPTNNGNVGTLHFEWGEPSFVQDTVVLFCNQTLSYTDDEGKKVLLYPKAYIKLWPETTNLIEYTAGTDPTPSYKNSLVNEGLVEKCREIEQKITMSDGKVFCGILGYELNSYDTGRTMFYPHIIVKRMKFSKVSSLKKSGDLTTIELEFDIPFETSNNTGEGTKKIKISYLKKEVPIADELLSTSFSKGISWKDDSLQLFVEKKENWKLAGEKRTSIKSSWLDFMIDCSEDSSQTVSNFDFEGNLTPQSSPKEDISRDGWSVKRGLATQVVRFSNGKENFVNAFTYPLYEVSVTWSGQTFDFDLSVNFNETHTITKYSEYSAKCVTTGAVFLSDKRLEKTVTTRLTIDEQDPSGGDDPSSYTGPKYGKILGYYVSAVFNPALLDNGRGALTEKCVLIHYETGYELGICAYNEDFPSSFAYVANSFGGYTSVAKHNPDDSYQLTYVQESSSKILWYNDKGKLISGIDAVTCMIYGWLHIVNKQYASMFNTYNGQYSNKNHTLVITAPSGATRTFNSSPVN